MTLNNVLLYKTSNVTATDGAASYCTFVKLLELFLRGKLASPSQR